MNAAIQDLLSQIEANRKEAARIVEGLDDATFNRQPAQGEWSIAECITHMTKTTGVDFPFLEDAIRSARQRGITGEGPYRYGWISRWFVGSMEPPPKRKFKAPSIYVPPPSAKLAEAMADYNAGLDKMAAFARQADGLDLAKVKTALPVAPKLLRMPLGARFALFTAHDRRHLWQASRVREQVRNGS